MKKTILFLGLGALSMSLASCLDDDDNDIYRPTALVTVCPDSDGGFTMQLDNTTKLVPVNMKSSPYGSKEVRALVNYTEEGEYDDNSRIRNVHVNWLDSIRTKLPVESAGGDNDQKFGNDPIEIMHDWVTVAEDGYLTLRIRTLWGSGAVHVINLLTGINDSDPFELELRHDANGDRAERWGDALIAFNLNNLPRTSDNAKIKLHWKSFSGDKSAEFEIEMRPETPEIYTADLVGAGMIE